MRRLREWYRVDCYGSHASLVIGTRDGVELGGTAEYQL